MEDNINAEWTDEEVCRMVDEARAEIRKERTDSQAAKRGWTFEKLCDDIDVCTALERTLFCLRILLPLGTKTAFATTARAAALWRF